MAWRNAGRSGHARSSRIRPRTAERSCCSASVNRSSPEPVSVIMIERREFMAHLGAAGLGGTLLPGALYALAQQEQSSITKEMVAQAEKIAGLEFTDEER